MSISEIIFAALVVNNLVLVYICALLLIELHRRARDDE